MVYPSIIHARQIKYGSYLIAVINKKLKSGPDLINQIISILVKFREDFVVIIDIEAMFYQVFMADQHKNLLIFLWWENGDINEEHSQH